MDTERRNAVALPQLLAMICTGVSGRAMKHDLRSSASVFALRPDDLPLG